MSDNEIKQALAKAAESLTKRTVTDDQKDRLLRSFKTRQGTIPDKITATLGEFTGLTPTQIHTKRASDDNADRAIRDLENVLRK